MHRQPESMALGRAVKTWPSLLIALARWLLAPFTYCTLAALRYRIHQLQRSAKFSKSIPLAQIALTLSEVFLGPAQPGTARSLNILATQYEYSGNYNKAEPLYRLSLRILQRVRGPGHPDTAIGLNDLANVYSAKGSYARAEPLYRRALEINEKIFGPEHREIGTNSKNLARFYELTGEFAKAERSYQRALNIQETALGPEHPDTANTLSGLALLYDSMGDYAKAEILFKRAHKFMEKALGPQHPDTVGSLNNLAVIYYHMGDYAKAEPLYQRVTEFCHTVLGRYHPNTAISANNSARLSLDAGDCEKAGRLFQEALQISERAFGPCHPMTARSLNGLAAVCDRKGDYIEAEQLYQRALKLRATALGANHPDTAKTLNALAWVYVDMGNPKEGLRLAKQARAATENTLSNILSFTSEGQRLAFQKTINLYAFPATMGNAVELAEIIVRHKGVVLDSLVEDRLVAEASLEPHKRRIIVQLRINKQRLMQLQLETPKDFSQESIKRREIEMEELSRNIDEMESSLARQVAGLGRARRALSVEVNNVQAALRKDQTLVELLRYTHYLGKGEWQPRYGAIIIPASGEPKWIPLGRADEIERHIQTYKRLARGERDEATLSSVLHVLYTQLWAPIEIVLASNTRTIFISPDAELSFVSFATLVASDDKFLAEKYSVRYVAGGRDLFSETKPSSSPAIFIFANPDFDSDLSKPPSSQALITPLRLAEMHDLQTVWLPQLPGTAAEAAALEKRIGKDACVFLGSTATEAELRQVNSPYVLHLATHGFFLAEIDFGKATGASLRNEDIPKGKLVNPMHRSGLALAGAQRTLEAWVRGEVPPTENDGIVTAEEVGGLKLDGTWLVVLSACDTGLGEARAGEGVMGLRRGFVQAGTQNLLMTLWPISDDATVQIMLDFYDCAFESGNAPQSLAEVQREWLVKLRKDRGLLDAVRLAGPFIMSSQGKQQTL